MDDADCVAAVLRGDGEAFAHLVRRYHRRLYFCVVGKITDSSEAEDIVQKTFVSAFHNLVAFDPGEPLFPWLRGIALNHCRNAWRQAARRARLKDRLLEAKRAELQLGLLDQPDPGEEHRHVALRQCLEGLSEPEQKAVQLRFVEELSLREIGQSLGKTAEAARLFLFRIRTRLAECVKRRLSLSGEGG
jgi:RNA polymerase sigma-70 factor (ECF subfamily)